MIIVNGFVTSQRETCLIVAEACFSRRLYGPRGPGFGATASIIWQRSSIDQSVGDTPGAIAGDILSVL